MEKYAGWWNNLHVLPPGKEHDFLSNMTHMYINIQETKIQV